MSKKQFVTFLIDEYLLGIDILKVREINLCLDITPAQHAPPHVLGLINLRGQTVTVLDLGVLLGLAPRPVSVQSHNIICKDKAVGLLVDQIGDVLDVEEEELEQPPANLFQASRVKNDFIAGVVQLKNDLLMILEPVKILKPGLS